MFWGLIMEPHKRYTQIVEKSFHVSMASLDVSTAGSYVGAVQVMINYENRNYLLCTLQKGTTLQVPLDLNFQEGTKIAFTSNGSGHVHLTGYLIPEEDDFDDELEEEEEEEDADVPQLVGKSSKRKAAVNLNQSQTNNKRSKHEQEGESSDDDNEDDDDEDSDLGDEFPEDGLEDEEEEDEDEELDDDEEDEDDEKVEEIVKQPVKKAKKNKKDKQKLVNGKDNKQEQKQHESKQEKKNKGEQQQSQNNKQEQKKRVVEGGVQVEDLKVGSGAPAKSGKFVSVYYIGRLKNGKKFDSCNQGEGFKFRLGKKEVIQGWDVGIAGMKIGGKRRITIPPAFAYGAKGSPPVIPPNSSLVFEVELKNVH